MKTTVSDKYLHEFEWSFHNIPKAEHRAAWLWELDRTLGSGGEPWLALHHDIKRRVEKIAPSDPSSPALHEHKLLRATPEFVHLFETLYHEYPERVSAPPGHNRLHLLHIDWSCSKTKILRELNQWVERQLKAVPSTARKIDKGGRKEQFMSWFVDLAIYRASEAGITRTAAIKFLRPILSGISSSKTGKTSPSHWEDAQKITRKRLFDRMVDLEVRAIVLQQQVETAAFRKTWRGFTLAGLLLRQQGDLISHEHETAEGST